MNRQTLFTSILLLLAVALNAQETYTEATPAQRQVMQEKIAASTGRLKSLVCSFEQTKSLSILNEDMVSKGKMYYRSDNSVRWEYTSPYAYTFIFSKNKIMMLSEGSRSVVDIKSNNLFQEIVKIMISCMNGSGLSDTKSFAPRFYHSDKGAWMVSLAPQQKEVRQMFTAIKLYFNPTDYSVDAVGMEEKNGDATLIRLSDKKINEKIDDLKFSLD